MRGPKSYLDQALRQDPNLKQAAAMRDTARAVQDLDPFISWLGEHERERRARRAVDQAMTRLEACAAQRGIDLQGSAGSSLSNALRAGHRYPNQYAATLLHPRFGMGFQHHGLGLRN